MAEEGKGDVTMAESEDGGAGGGKQMKPLKTARRNTPYQKQSGPSPRAQYSDDKSRRVYVGNLSWDVTWKELKDHMKTTGFEVTRADVLQTFDGRSKGCGIVEFADPDGARKAVLTLNDTDLMGRQIFVREDREDTPNVAAPAGAGADGNDATVENGGQSRRVYVGNLSWDVAWQDLKDHMREVGEVLFAQVMTEPDGRSKGCGIVEYATPQEAQNAIATLTDTELKGRMIFVREDRENSSNAPKVGSSPCSVYVGNLSYETSWQDLKDHMRQAGNVDQANVLLMNDGRSKGCGIVVYQRPQDAARAIRELQNSVLKGRPIFVREDREKAGGAQGGGGHGGGGGHAGGGGFRPKGVNNAAAAPGCQLFVSNLSWDVDWKALKDHFRPYGDVERAEVAQGPDGRKKGFGTVRFSSPEQAQAAIQTLNGSELMGRNIEVRLDQKA